MADPIELPSEIPFNSVRVLMSFVRGKAPWDRDTLACAVTLVAYGAALAVPTGPRPVGELHDPAPIETKVCESLQALLDGEGAAPGVVGFGAVLWPVVIEFLISQILKRLAS